MQFCDECGTMMVSQDGEMVCTECGATSERDEERAAQFVSTESQSDDDLIETEEGANFEGKPECGHDEAWYTIKQTGAADEPPTRFFKCKECGYRWRDYN